MKGQAPVGRILVGVDGSPAAAAALRWAAAEARLRGMRLHVVHARDQDAVELAHYAPPSRDQGAVGHAAEGLALKAASRETFGPDAWSAVDNRQSGCFSSVRQARPCSSWAAPALSVWPTPRSASPGRRLAP
jgi:hypothetical protein